MIFHKNDEEKYSGHWKRVAFRNDGKSNGVTYDEVVFNIRTNITVKNVAISQACEMYN